MGGWERAYHLNEEASRFFFWEAGRARCYILKELSSLDIGKDEVDALFVRQCLVGGWWVGGWMDWVEV